MKDIAYVTQVFNFENEHIHMCTVMRLVSKQGKRHEICGGSARFEQVFLAIQQQFPKPPDNERKCREASP